MGCSLPGSSVHGILQAKNTGAGSHSLLQGVFLTERLNLGLLHRRQTPLSELPVKPTVTRVTLIKLFQQLVLSHFLHQ